MSVENCFTRAAFCEGEADNLKSGDALIIDKIFFQKFCRQFLLYCANDVKFRLSCGPFGGHNEMNQVVMRPFPLAR